MDTYRQVSIKFNKLLIFCKAMETISDKYGECNLKKSDQEINVSLFNGLITEYEKILESIRVEEILDTDEEDTLDEYISELRVIALAIRHNDLTKNEQDDVAYTMMILRYRIMDTCKCIMKRIGLHEIMK